MAEPRGEVPLQDIRHIAPPKCICIICTRVYSGRITGLVAAQSTAFLVFEFFFAFAFIVGLLLLRGHSLLHALGGTGLRSLSAYGLFGHHDIIELVLGNDVDGVGI